MTTSDSTDNAPIVILMGGLGNQLFQLAACFYFSNSREMKIRVDNFSGMARNDQGKENPESLKYFWGEKVTIEAPPSSGSLYIRQVLLSRLLRTSLKKREDNLHKMYKIGLQMILSMFFSPRKLSRSRLIAPSNLGYSSIKNIKEHSILLGYFQSYKYLEKENVRSIFMNLSLNDNEISRWRDLAVKEKPLVVHVRRGDYRNEESFGLLSNIYYKKAFDHLLKSADFGSIWVFSDEIDNAKNLVGEHWNFPIRYFSSEEYDSVQTLEIMRNGSHFIIANSSFSYWAATLSKATNKIVVCPEPWFRKLEEPADLINPEWYRIKAHWDDEMVE